MKTSRRKKKQPAQPTPASAGKNSGAIKSSGIKKILIMGKQACGKGTQADLIAKEYAIAHISTGDLFRDIREEDSPLGKKVKQLIDHGSLVPDKITNEIVLRRLGDDDCKNGFILDGYPRNAGQAEFLETNNVGVTSCLLIDITDEEAMRRLLARRVCPKCKANYNTIFKKPKKDGICDACGTEIERRADDNPEAIKKRLADFHKLTSPVLDFYERKGLLKRINGNQPIETVFSDIKKILAK